MNAIARWARTFVAALAVGGVMAYGAAALVTVGDILGRTVGLPVRGVVDLVQLFIMTGAWLVMPYAFMTAAHVGVDVLITALPRALSMPLRVLAGVASLALVALMLWQGYATYLTRTMFGDKSQQLGIPIAWYWYPLLVGLAVSLVGIVVELGRSLRKDPEHE